MPHLHSAGSCECLVLEVDLHHVSPQSQGQADVRFIYM